MTFYQNAILKTDHKSALKLGRVISVIYKLMTSFNHVTFINNMLKQHATTRSRLFVEHHRRKMNENQLQRSERTEFLGVTQHNIGLIKLRSRQKESVCADVYVRLYIHHTATPAKLVSPLSSAAVAPCISAVVSQEFF